MQYKIKTTMQPEVELTVDKTEAVELARQGLLVACDPILESEPEPVVALSPDEALKIIDGAAEDAEDAEPEGTPPSAVQLDQNAAVKADKAPADAKATDPAAGQNQEK